MTSPLLAQTVRYEDMCEASAAVALPDGRFAVASDDREELQVYRPLIPFGTEITTFDEVNDIEGAARIGDTAFWITSHSRTKNKGKDKPERKRLFATIMGPDGVPVTAGTMKGDLRAHLASILAEVLRDKEIDDPHSSRLNIEGLAASPGGSLLVGLRAPLTTEGRAVVAWLPRPFAMLNLPQPEPEVVEVPVRSLDLAGRGIRSLEAAPEGGYLILASNSVEEAANPALFWWDGQEKTKEITGVDLSDLNPEAMIIWQPGWVQVLSDNGESACSDDPEKNEGRLRWFPSRMLHYEIPE